MPLGRITRSEDFSDILRRGTHSRSHGLVVSYCPSDSGPRLGFAVGRGAGNAVQRNRFRRVVREYLRHVELPAVDVVVSLRTTIKPLTNTEIRESMTILLRNNGWLA